MITQATTLKAILRAKPFLLMLFLLTAQIQFTNAQTELGIIPIPKTLIKSGSYLTLTTSSRIVYTNAALQPLANILKEDIAKVTGLNLAVISGGGANGDIELHLNGGLPNEGYTVNINSKIVITGKDYRATVWGTSTLLQAINSNGSVKQITVNDSPDTGYRGLMGDLARQWHPVQNLQDIINLCRLYKVNYLHLHFMDSQSFTFPSTAYPLLNSPGNSYTLAEVQALEAYSQARGVTIVPELEVPGHANKMIETYPNLFGSGTEGAINMARADVRAAVGTLVNEIADVFRATPYFHIGCDEVDKSGMGTHPDYVRAFEELGVGDVNGVFNYFINEVTGYVEARGKRAMAWEGFDSGRTGVTQVNKNLIVCPFDNYTTANTYAANGHDILNTSWFPLYLVPNTYVPPSKIYNWELAQFGNYNGASPRSHTNVNQYLMTNTGKLIGAQTCSWEQQAAFEIPSLRSRLSPMSERVWNTNAGLSFSNYQSRFEKSDQVLTKILASDLPGSITPSASFEVFSDKISISWRPASEYPSSYTLYRSTSDNSATATAILSNTTLTTYEDFNVNAGQTYYYWVKGINTIGIGAFGGSADGRLGNASLTMSHEPFEYSGNSSPNGQNGGVGFNDAWNITDFAGSASISSQSLNYTNLQTSGNSLAINMSGASNSFNIERSLAGSLCPEGSEVWVSFLIKANSIGVGHFFFGLGNAPIGKVWGNGIEIPGVVNAQHALEAGVTTLVVMKIKSYNGTDDVHIWTNPLVNGVEPDINAPNCYFTDRADFGTNPIIGINVQHHGEGSYELDEVRIGDSFDDVLPLINCNTGGPTNHCQYTTNNTGYINTCDIVVSEGEQLIYTFSGCDENLSLNLSGSNGFNQNSVGACGEILVSNNITSNMAGTYTAVLTDKTTGCSTTSTVTIQVIASPCDNGGAPRNECQYTTNNTGYINTCDIVVNEGEQLIYTFSGCDENLSLNLSGSNGFNQNSVGACGEILVSNNITPNMAGTYSAVLTDKTTGCSTTSTVTIQVQPKIEIFDNPIEGSVWVDTNADGIRNPGEAGIPGVTVRLFFDNNRDDFAERIISTAQSDQNGNYRLNFPGSGKYQIGIDPLSLPEDKYRLTEQDALGDDTVDNDVSPHTFRSEVFESNPGKVDIGILQGRGNLIFIGNGEIAGEPVHRWLYQDIHLQIQDTGLDPNDANYQSIIAKWTKWYAVAERITQEAEVLPGYLNLARHENHVPEADVSVKHFHTVKGLGSYASGRGAVSSGVPAQTLLNNPDVVVDHILMFYETTRGANPIWKYRANWPFGGRLTHHALTSMTLEELGGFNALMQAPNVTSWNPGRDHLNELSRWESAGLSYNEGFPIDPNYIEGGDELVNQTSVAFPNPDNPAQMTTVSSRGVQTAIIIKTLVDMGREKAIEALHNMSTKSWYSPSQDQALINFKQAVNDATDGRYNFDFSQKWGFPTDAFYNDTRAINSGSFTNQPTYKYDLKPHNYAPNKIRPGYAHLSDRTTQGFVRWVDADGSSFKNLGAIDYLAPQAAITYPNEDANLVIGKGVSFTHQLPKGKWLVELNIIRESAGAISFTGDELIERNGNTFLVSIKDGALNMSFNSEVRISEMTLQADNSCPNNIDNVGSACDDGDACTGNDTIDASCKCTGAPGSIVCHANINNKGWLQVCDVTLSSGQSVKFGPSTNINSGPGTWNWTGPDGFTANTRETTVSEGGTYVVTFSNGICTFTQDIIVKTCTNNTPLNYCQYFSTNSNGFISTCDIVVTEGEKLIYTFWGCDENLSLNLSGANGFNQNSVGACGEILVSENISTNMAGNYTAVLTDKTTGCSSTQPVTIKVQPITGKGLSAVYYDNMDFTGNTLNRVDEVVDFNWGLGSPDASIANDTYSARWTGYVEAPTSGTYTFFTSTDDGVRLWVNNQQLINQWVDQAPKEYSGTIEMRAGEKLPIQMEYYENGGGAVAQLMWQGPGVGKQIVPKANLYQGNGNNRLASIDNEGLHIYPNPASNYLNVDLTDVFEHLGNDESVTVKIYSKEGKLIKERTTSNANIFKIDIQELESKQYYFINVQTDGSKSTSSIFLKM